MKKLMELIIFITALSIFSSCNYITDIAKIGATEISESDIISFNDLENIEFALDFVNPEFDKPNLYFNIQSGSDFNNNHTNESGFSIIKPKPSLLYSLIIPLGFIFYILGSIVCLIIILKNDFKNPIDKIAWVVTVIFAPAIGIILFILIGRKQINSARD